MSETPRRWQTYVLLGLLLFSALLFGFDAASRVAPNLLLILPVDLFIPEQAIILTIVLAAMILTATLRPPEWEWVLGVLLFWALGTVVETLTSDPLSPIDGWQRLASLVALPMISILLHRQVTPPPPSPIVVGSHLAQAVEIASLVQTIGSARDLPATLIMASSKLADLLDADLCTVMLTEDEDKLQVVAIHPPTSAQITSPVLSLDDYEGLKTAVDDAHPVLAPSPGSAPWVAPLCDLLGLPEPQGLAVVPLAQQGRQLGVLALGRALDRDPWQEEALADPLLIAGLLTDAIAMSQSRSASGGLLGATSEGKGARASGDPVLAREQQLESAVEKAKEQIQALNARIRTLVQEVKARDDEIATLTSGSESGSASETELAVWQSEVKQLADEREALERKLMGITEDRDALLDERTRLTEELASVKRYVEQVETHREDLEEEIGRLQARVETHRAEAPPVALSVSDEGARATVSEPAGHGGPVGLLIADEAGQIVMADALARQMMRLPKGDVVGLPVDGVYPDPQWSRAVDDLLHWSEEEPQDRTHLTITLDDGVVEADLATLRGRDNETDGLVVVLRSSESDSEQYEALVSVASDFRTPMTAITGYTDLLLGEQAGILTEMQQQFLERVKANVEQLNQSLNDLVQIASPDSRPAELRPEPVNLIEIIEEAIMGLAARFRERRLAVQLDLPNELAPVRADRDSLYQIMLRLLSNAVLCSKEGTQVVVRAEEEVYSEDGKHLRISVVDTGGGVAPEDYSRVFRRFYRANQPLVEGMGETGVGMAMAKALVEANGGRIWIESEPDAGSTFSFLLPAES
jgi:signal transduction histidine kinase/GAF domain-containing protein